MAFQFIDLFAGVGGIRIPFDELGGHCVFTSEWDIHAQKTYAANFGHVPEGDITKVDVQNIPSHNILLGGFPCQPFSQAGHKLGFDDTRGTLFFDVARILEFHKPEIFLLENVKGFLGHDKGRTFQVVKKVLEDLNYLVFFKVLNARDFGVPQNRERIYIVGIHKEKLGSFVFTFPTPPQVDVRVGNILEKVVDEKYTLSDALWEGHKRRKREHLLKGNGFGYSLFNSESKYTSTISARYYKDGSEILIEQQNKNPRKLTPREAARLQGFPDSFVIPVSDTQAYKQFGNSVAVPVIREIAIKLIEILDYPEKRIPFEDWRQDSLLLK